MPINIVSLPIFFFDSLPSTNDKLMEFCATNCKDGTAVVALLQEQGRGQQGAIWESEAGQNICLSIAFKPTFLPVMQMFYLSKVVAISIWQFLQQQGVSAKIKWPNDILVKDKKICGVLIEQQTCGNSISQSIVGVGLNLNQEKFAHAPNATSLFLEDLQRRDVKSIAIALQSCIFNNYISLQNNFHSKAYRTTIDAEYFRYLYRNQGVFEFSAADKPFKASIVNVSPSGELSLQVEGGAVEKFYFKEVEFL
ncbi:MAG: biotin--[acetyl-CoA-carboxylase] ligase [Bacteroidales bacterium]